MNRVRYSGRCAWLIAMVVSAVWILVQPAAVSEETGKVEAGKPGEVVVAPGVPVPPTDRPRLYIRPADLSALKAKLEHPKLKPLWDKFKDTDQMCMALNYVLTKDEAVAEKLRKSLKGLKVQGSAQKFTYEPHRSVILYDWCYDLLTPEQRQAFVESAKRYWGPNSENQEGEKNRRRYTFVGHDVEGPLHCGALPTGVAIYEDWPNIYAVESKYWLEQLVPTENYIYKAMWHHQGGAYSTYRFVHPLLSTYMMEHFSGKKFVNETQRLIPYQTIYHTLPTGQRFLYYGDQMAGTAVWPGNGSSLLICGTLDRNPYFYYALNHVPSMEYPVRLGNSEWPPFLYFLFYDPSIEEKPLTDLPLTRYFPADAGVMLARTGWEFGPQSKDALVYMKIGCKHFCNHNHLDAGTFQIYYRGYPAMKSGYLTANRHQYYREYFHRTISENGLLIFDPSEKPVYGAEFVVNDGGQCEHGKNGGGPRNLADVATGIFDSGEILAHEFGPDAKAPDYTYLSGDITKAYAPAKAGLVTRSMVFFSLKQEKVPGLFVTFDRMTAKDPGFKKTWLLHCEQEPKITKGADRTTTVVTHTGLDNTYQYYLDSTDPKKKDPATDFRAYSTKDLVYNGKLVVESLLPHAVKAEAARGFVVNGKDTLDGLPDSEFFQGGRKRFEDIVMKQFLTGPWRVEISPAEARKDDLLLNVMTIMDADQEAPAKAALIENDAWAGASLLGRAVVFSKEKKLQNAAAFELKGAGEFNVLVCDLEEGSYKVAVGGKALGTFPTRKDEGKCLYVKGPAGSWTIEGVK